MRFLRGHIPSAVSALQVAYRNAVSGLAAGNVQAALDELAALAAAGVTAAQVAYDAVISGFSAGNVQAAIDEIVKPGVIDTYATPGNVVLSSEQEHIRRIRCQLPVGGLSVTISHPLLTTNAYVDSQLEASGARVFGAAYSLGSVTLTTTTTTTLAIIVAIIYF